MRKRTPQTTARARIYAIVNQKGGVGKTTTAINLAAALALDGKRVLLIDIDAQGNATTGVGARAAFESDDAKTIYQALFDEIPLREVVTETSVGKLWIVPSSRELMGIDIKLSQHARSTHVLRDMLGVDAHQGEVVHDYDYIFIDCPPALGLLALNGIAAADGVIAPVQCEYFALEGVRHLLRSIGYVKQHLNPAVGISGVLLTMYDKRNNLARQVTEDVRKNLDDLVFETMIPRNVRLAEAPSYEMPALIYDRHCSGSQAYFQLASELIAREGVTSD